MFNWTLDSKCDISPKYDSWYSASNGSRRLSVRHLPCERIEMALKHLSQTLLVLSFRKGFRPPLPHEPLIVSNISKDSHHLQTRPWPFRRVNWWWDLRPLFQICLRFPAPVVPHDDHKPIRSSPSCFRFPLATISISTLFTSNPSLFSFSSLSYSSPFRIPAVACPQSFNLDATHWARVRALAKAKSPTTFSASLPSSRYSDLAFSNVPSRLEAKSRMG